MFYNAASPGFYVFDFSVENVNYDKPTDLLFQNFLVDAQTKTLSKGAQHQIFVTEFKTAGWQLLLLESKTAWKFFSVEVSQFK